MSRIGPGSVIAGRYQVEAQIGIGGMASVFRAEDIQLGRKVAVKVLHAQYAEDQEFVERFRREAKAAAQLQHPGIVAVYDTGSWDGTWYIAMELLEGPTLKERLNREGRFAPAEAISLTEAILKAVRAAHRDGIIHRDLKPHNVILDDQGNPKVTDFGIARRGASDMTATGSVLGTAHYLAPEQAQGEVITPRTDLYSVGVVLYEMLTGRTPFEGETAITIALAHVNNEPRSPRSIVPEITPALDAVVMRALAKRPSDRFADADAFLAALGDASRGIAPIYAPVTGEHGVTSISDRRASNDRRTGAMDAIVVDDRPWWKKPWAIGLGALAIIALLVGGLLLTNKPRVEVPNVIDAKVDTAQDRLEADGFKVTITRRNSNRPADTVVGQTPTGGTRVAKGSEVGLSVSDGPGDGTIPQVDGQTLSVARDRIESAGFRTRTRDQSSEDVATGRVIETSPSGGSVAELDQVVTIVVSTGRRQVDMPDVVGQPLDAARATLGELGLTTKVIEQETVDREAGTVLSSDPRSGTSVRTGTSVTLTVAAEPSTATVPDVVGRSENGATNALQAAGFTVRVTKETTTNKAENDRVISSDPAAGQERDRNTVVTIVVGAYDAPATTPESGGTTP